MAAEVIHRRDRKPDRYASFGTPTTVSNTLTPAKERSKHGPRGKYRPKRSTTEIMSGETVLGGITVGFQLGLVPLHPIHPPKGGTEEEAEVDGDEDVETQEVR
mmetsp:Transcript_23815/g.51793  ORF Transcript_23815/g.51793 Transcript_23815/m.51793 type:complete len:103 (+) Transcript_23815:298-606(+)